MILVIFMVFLFEPLHIISDLLHILLNRREGNLRVLNLVINPFLLSRINYQTKNLSDSAKMDKAFMKQAMPPVLKIEGLRPIFIGVELIRQGFKRGGKRTLY